VVVGWGERHDAFLGVNRRDFLALIGPVPEPVAVQPHVLFILPALGPVALVGKDAFPAALGAADVHRSRSLHLHDLDKTLVGPAGDPHGPALEKQFQAAPGRAAEIGHFLRTQVRLQHVAASARVQTLQQHRIGHRREARDAFAADQPDRVTWPSAVLDRRLRRPGIVGRQLQRAVSFVDAAAQLDHHAPGRQRSGLFQTPNGIAGAFEGRQGSVRFRRFRFQQFAGPRIVAVWGNKKRCRLRRCGRDTNQIRPRESQQYETKAHHLWSPKNCRPWAGTWE